MNDRLSGILEKARGAQPPTPDDVSYLLSLRSEETIDQVMAAARDVRREHFGDRIYLYGFIYLSTYCRNHCSFCFYRKSNSASPRYRKSISQVVDIAKQLVDSGVHLVDLTLGEDPQIHARGDYGLLLDIITSVTDAVDVPLMISPGVVPDEVLRSFRPLGVDWYALYQETHNPTLYGTLRTGQSFAERCAKRTLALQTGMLVEDGMLLGVGETVQDRADAIAAMSDAGVHQVRSMGFVPQEGTPLAGRASPPTTLECLTIAVMRLTMPSKLIPASLDVDGLHGLRSRLQAGANVVTSIIPPSNHLAGVSRSSLDIEQGRRSVSAVKAVIAELGLRPGTLKGYRSWLVSQRETVQPRREHPDESGHCRGTPSGIGGRVSESRSWLRNGTF